MPIYLREESHRDVVMDTISSIKGNSDDYELIIIDDGSPLNTGFARSEADVYVRQPNQGISRAWNVGMMLARNDYVAIVNDDIRVTNGWLNKLESGFNNPDAGVTAPVAGGPHLQPQITDDREYENNRFYPGYCFMLKKDRFYQPFDEQFRSNCGDCDYWTRIEADKKKLWRVPLQVYHKEGGVLHGMDYVKLSESSIKLFIDKHGFNPQPVYYS